MDLETAIKGVLDAESKLRSPQGVNSPTFMSQQMMRLSQFTGAAEEHLAKYEQDFELDSAKALKFYMIDQKMAVTAAEKRAKIETADLKAQIKYLERIIQSAWRQVGVIQSRINHLAREASTNI